MLLESWKFSTNRILITHNHEALVQRPTSFTSDFGSSGFICRRCCGFRSGRWHRRASCCAPLPGYRRSLQRGLPPRRHSPALLAGLLLHSLLSRRGDGSTAFSWGRLGSCSGGAASTRTSCRRRTHRSDSYCSCHDSAESGSTNSDTSNCATAELAALRCNLRRRVSRRWGAIGARRRSIGRCGGCTSASARARRTADGRDRCAADGRASQLQRCGRRREVGKATRKQRS